jgi:MFS transporter, Spinster family, sphingosine-1-phosphate transporter
VVLIGGGLADRLGPKHKAAYPLIPAIAVVISIPLYALGTLAVEPALVFALLFIPQALSLIWLGPVVTSIQHLGPPASRTSLSALFLLITNLIGMGVGTWFFGAMSDALKPEFGAQSLKLAFLIGLSFYALAAILLWRASKTLKTDWID